MGLFRADVDFDVTLGEFGRYVSNGSRRVDAMCLESFNEKWEAWANAWQSQQAKVEELEGKLKQAYEDVDTFAEAYERECGFKAQLAKDKAELQKRVDQQGLIIANVMSIASDLQKSWSMFEIGKKLEQALKGDQYDEHRKKAEEAISKGASLTNHRIEL
ncbi:hypothetical protein L1Y79_00620 [Acinetobacter baumannii]|uniref:hypothetical protein n=1 Tax=Acinetobacter baumannii TaxID=470 RepID=UPI001FEEA8FD|nr:hypothetical protein [Acinetobacter baumannii]MCF4292089.1 hypothetical protein [Acinetobacter baumannii]MCF4311327.1 hypothetical protein [Acinetobacter baumannii]MCF4559798.1 hypothetical protein [Acinetobacter baumannii]MCF4663778.1 hypothetical protein [Acinetobacter baumannii]MDG5634217.1 hypothetical protein [Acinetobacter baumannii]